MNAQQIAYLVLSQIKSGKTIEDAKSLAGSMTGKTPAQIERALKKVPVEEMNAAVEAWKTK